MRITQKGELVTREPRVSHWPGFRIPTYFIGRTLHKTALLWRREIPTLPNRAISEFRNYQRGVMSVREKSAPQLTACYGRPLQESRFPKPEGKCEFRVNRLASNNTLYSRPVERQEIFSFGRATALWQVHRVTEGGVDQINGQRIRWMRVRCGVVQTVGCEQRGNFGVHYQIAGPRAVPGDSEAGAFDAVANDLVLRICAPKWTLLFQEWRVRSGKRCVKAISSWVQIYHAEPGWRSNSDFRSNLPSGLSLLRCFDQPKDWSLSGDSSISLGSVSS